MLIYYIQNNIVCLILLGILFANVLRTKEKTNDQKLFHMFIVCTIWFCVADIMAWVFSGVQGVFATIMLYASNMAYFISSVLATYLWLLYALEKMDVNRGVKHKFRYIAVIPFFLFMIFVFLSPAVHGIFYISPENHYVRGKLVWLHWIIAYGYTATPTIMAIVTAIRTKDKVFRKNIFPLISFIIFPVGASIVQVVFSVTSTIQVGLTLSVLLVFLAQQNSYSFKDSLTGVYNRRYLDYYLNSRLPDMPKNMDVFMIMIDIDAFKHINDEFGHLTGDRVLKQIGLALNTATEKRRGVFAARYGGDEFVIFGYGDVIKDKDMIVETILNEIGKWNHGPDKFDINISTGFVSGKVDEFPNSDLLLAEADSRMYEMKNKKR